MTKNDVFAISIDSKCLEEMDRLVKTGAFPSRSNLIQTAVEEKLDRLKRRRLATECGKLDRECEKRAADELFAGEVPSPEY